MIFLYIQTDGLHKTTVLTENQNLIFTFQHVGFSGSVLGHVKKFSILRIDCGYDCRIALGPGRILSINPVRKYEQKNKKPHGISIRQLMTSLKQNIDLTNITQL